MRRTVLSIIAFSTGVVLSGWSSAQAANEDAAPRPAFAVEQVDVGTVVVAQARTFRDAVRSTPPPVLLAQSVVPVKPVAAAQAVPTLVAQGSVVHIVTPVGSGPGVLWLLGMGAVLCRIGSRLLRMS